VQGRPLRPDSDAGKHDVHSDGDECRSLPCYLSSASAHLQTEGDDSRVVVGGARLRHASALHLQTGLILIHIQGGPKSKPLADLSLN